MAELVSIGSVLPFIGVLVDPGPVYDHPSMQWLVSQGKIESPEDMVFPMAVIFSVAAVLAGGFRLFVLWASTRVSFAAGADLSLEMFRRTLLQPFSIHTSRNSSELINAITAKAGTVIYGGIVPVLVIVSSLLLLVIIGSTLIAISPTITLTALLSLGAAYTIVGRLTKTRLLKNGEIIASNSTLVVKLLQEALGGIREVLIHGLQRVFVTSYGQADGDLRRSQASNLFVSQSPRYVMEAVGMLLIALFALFLTRTEEGLLSGLPLMGVMVLAAQRLLPVVQQSFGAWSSIQGSRDSLRDALHLLNQEVPAYSDRHPTRMQPTSAVRCRELGFRYGPELPWVLKGVDLEVVVGSSIGILGETGSGKSTLLDVVMGLQRPTEGSLELDGTRITDSNLRSWQACIAHVPQDIFLMDGSVAENIAFGADQDGLDRERMEMAAKMAMIHDVVLEWSDGYDTHVGERGIRISGGQRQRIGIARALYRQAPILILDEATSALDPETEGKVIRAIETGTRSTLLVVSHRVATVEKCDQVVRLESARLHTIRGSGSS